MDVVGHEAISGERDGTKAQILLQKIEIDVFLGVGGEQELAGVAALGDVVWHVSECDTCKAWHRMRIAENVPDEGTDGTFPWTYPTALCSAAIRKRSVCPLASHVLQRDPQVSIIEGAGVETSLPNMATGTMRGIPERCKASVDLFECDR